MRRTKLAGPVCQFSSANSVSYRILKSPWKRVFWVLENPGIWSLKSPEKQCFNICTNSGWKPLSENLCINFVACLLFNVDCVHRYVITTNLSSRVHHFYPAWNEPDKNTAEYFDVSYFICHLYLTTSSSNNNVTLLLLFIIIYFILFYYFDLR